MEAGSRSRALISDLESSVAAFFDLLTQKATAGQPHGDDGGRQSRDNREESKRSVSDFVQCVDETLLYVNELAAQLPETQLRHEVQQLQDELHKKVRHPPPLQGQLYHSAGSCVTAESHLAHSPDSQHGPGHCSRRVCGAQNELIEGSKVKLAEWRDRHKSLQARYQQVSSLGLETDA